MAARLINFYLSNLNKTYQLSKMLKLKQKFIFFYKIKLLLFHNADFFHLRKLTILFIISL